MDEAQVTQGPPETAMSKTRELTASFVAKVDSLQAWRNEDHEDNITLSRNYIVELLEGIFTLHAQVAVLTPSSGPSATPPRLDPHTVEVCAGVAETTLRKRYRTLTGELRSLSEAEIFIAVAIRALLTAPEETPEEVEQWAKNFEGHSKAFGEANRPLAADITAPEQSGENARDYWQTTLEEAREYSRNLYRSKALREREHYGLIAIIDKAERAMLLRGFVTASPTPPKMGEESK